MKVKASVKPICANAKLLKEKEKSELFVKIQNINKDKVNIGGVLWHVLKV